MQSRENLRACRDELKGLAILWVVLFHAKLGLTGILYDVQKLGYGGVDIFFFLSGFGLYHSLERSSDLRDYLVRRAWRLLPAYLPFCLVWFAVMLPLFRYGAVDTVRAIAGNLTMDGFWAGVPKTVNWYVGGLALSLMAAPFAHAVLSKARRPARALLAMMGLAFFAGLAFVNQNQYMAVSRLPVFLLGMGFAMPGAEERGSGSAGLAPLPSKPSGFAGLAARKRGPGAIFACYAAAFAAGLASLLVCYARYPEALAAYGMYWHPFVLITPPLCAAIAWGLRKAARFRTAFAPLRFLGRASFEIFLVNAMLELYAAQTGCLSTPEQWAWWSLGSVAVGCLYHAVVAEGVKRARKLRKNPNADNGGEKSAV